MTPTTEVAWAEKRLFAVAFTQAARLELAIDLLRTVQHPLVWSSFATTKKVVTHRLSVTSLDQIDDFLESLVVEAWQTVGPGT